ncbi:MAG: 16S rRNA (adenine(1518)-N(6)/adenine(1519)-N(6))-dimethyltransferase RsmA [Acidobacteriota bacterium]
MIKAKKSLGQNFLIDTRVSRRIVDAVSPRDTDIIIEIGPGTGALTSLLAERAGRVLAVELDRRLADELRSKLARFENVSVVWHDALTLEWEDFIRRAESDFTATRGDTVPRVRVVANLPYYISTAIIDKLLVQRSRIFDMTLMLQREVVERITSGPGSRDYGYLSVLVQYHCEASRLFDVPPEAFKPAPRVDSAVARLLVREQPAVRVQDESKFFAVVRACFAQRRKTILNNLKAASSQMTFLSPIEEALRAAGVEPRRRAETLSLAEFAALAGALYQIAEESAFRH